jgi:hypothetical protein
MFEFFAAIAALAGTVGTVQSMKASSANRRAQQAQADQQNLRAAQERRQAIRQQRIAFATAQQNAANQGVSTSSGAYGGQGSIISQGNANLSFLDDNILSAKRIGGFMDKAAGYQASAGMWGALSNLAMVGMSNSTAPEWLTGKKPQAKTPGSISSNKKGPW